MSVDSRMATPGLVRAAARARSAIAIMPRAGGHVGNPGEEDGIVQTGPVHDDGQQSLRTRGGAESPDPQRRSGSDLVPCAEQVLASSTHPACPITALNPTGCVASRPQTHGESGPVLLQHAAKSSHPLTWVNETVFLPLRP
jgi:hypothetical protein